MLFSVFVIGCHCCFSSGAKPPLTLTGQATPAVVAKRDVGDKPSNEDCVIYRYGSFCTGIEVFGELPSTRVRFRAERLG